MRPNFRPVREIILSIPKKSITITTNAQTEKSPKSTRQTVHPAATAPTADLAICKSAGTMILVWASDNKTNLMFELGVIKRFIGAALNLEQFAVRPLFNHFAVVNDNDIVSILNG